MATNSFSPSKSFAKTPAACYPPLKPPAKDAPTFKNLFWISAGNAMITGCSIIPENDALPIGSPVQVQAWNNLGWTDLPTAVGNKIGDSSIHFPWFTGPGTATLNIKFTYVNGQVENWTDSLTGPPFEPH